MIILCTLDKLKVGQVKTGPNYVSDENGEWHYDVAFKVIREATIEEFLQQAKDYNITIDEQYLKDLQIHNFYQVHIDWGDYKWNQN